MADSNVQTRIIFFHKTPTSGRTRFLRFAYGGVCGFEPLPAAAQVYEPEELPSVTLHPAPLLKDAAAKLGLDVSLLEAEPEFHEWVDVARGPIQVFLARFTGIDPPLTEMEEQGGTFIELAHARGLPPVELQLLRTAYECVMEG